MFLKNEAHVSWKSVKQTVTTTFTNHTELLALHEASREVVWLRTMQKALAEQCKIELGSKPTIIYENNVVYIKQMTSGFNKADRIKHMSLHIFAYTRDLIEYGQIDVRKIESAHNIVDMLTKALPAYKHKTLVHDVGVRSLHEIIST